MTLTTCSTDEHHKLGTRKTLCYTMCELKDLLDFYMQSSEKMVLKPGIAQTMESVI